MSKNITNQTKYPGYDGIESDQGYRRAQMKQLERIENVLTAILEVLVDTAPKAKQKDIMYRVRDIIDDGKLNDSVDR